MRRRAVLGAGLAVTGQMVVPGVAGASFLPVPTRNPDHTAREAALDAVFAEKAPVALAGAVVGPDGLIWSGVRGVRRTGRPDLATLQDRWHLGSNTKAMTAALYGRLVEQGRADWDATLATAFPGMTIHAGWDGVTIRQVLQHRAGLSDASALGTLFFMTARADRRALPDQRRAMVERMLAKPPAGAPGTFEYGNANYMLVGAAIEQIMGQSWEEAMAAEVFAPLGLSSAGFGAPTAAFAAETSAQGNAWGHRGPVGRFVGMDPSNAVSDNPLALGPAGTVHMTLGDYARWLGVFLKQGDGWLKPETVTALTTPAPGGGASYALGWITTGQSGWAAGPAWLHEGSNTYWHVAAAVAPNRGRAVVGLANVGVDINAAGALMRGLVSTL